MPLYRFFCAVCDKTVRKMLEPGEQAQQQHCTCGEPLARSTPATSSDVMEVVDNGLMTRRVERYSEAERLFRERSDSRPSDEE
jgi:hypothetical protein